MTRLVALALALWPLAARAQLDAPPEPPLPEKETQPQTQKETQPQTQKETQPQTQKETQNPLAPPPPPSRYQSFVRAHRPSPDWTQDRSFTSTRFWLLDPGNFEVQTWARTRIFDGAPNELLLQQEIEVGLFPHVQLDLYENLSYVAAPNQPNNWNQEGVQLEARIAIPSYYGQMFGNPVLYLEWHPRHNAPDRAELRLLVGGAPTRWLYLAFNPYVESNIEPTDTAVATLVGGVPTVKTQTTFIADAELGTTAAAGFRITDWLRLSAELKIGADMLGDLKNRLHFVWFFGPGFIVKPLPERYRKYLKIMGTCLFAMPGTDGGAQRFEPLFIVGSQF
jgi:hypothetical protein